MKSFITIFCLLVIALFATVQCRPADNDDIEVVVNEIEREDDGSYTQRLELSNGVVQLEEGKVEEVQTVDEDGKPVTRAVLVKQGQSSFVDEETGAVLTVKWRADQNGYQAIGDHLPKAPEVDEE